MRGGVIGGQRHRLPIARDGLVVALLAAQHVATVAPGVGGIGLQRNGARIAFQRLVVAFEVAQRIAAVVEGVGVAGRQCQRALVALQRLRGPLQLVERVAAVVVHLGEGGIARYGALEARQRIGMPPEVAQRIAEIVVHFGASRIGGRRARQQIGRLLRLSRLRGNDAQQVQRIEMVGLRREHRAAEPLGLLPCTPLVCRHRAGDGVSERLRLRAVAGRQDHGGSRGGLALGHCLGGGGGATRDARLAFKRPMLAANPALGAGCRKRSLSVARADPVGPRAAGRAAKNGRPKAPVWTSARGSGLARKVRLEEVDDARGEALRPR